MATESVTHFLGFPPGRVAIIPSGVRVGDASAQVDPLPHAGPSPSEAQQPIPAVLSSCSHVIQTPGDKNHIVYCAHNITGATEASRQITWFNLRRRRSGWAAESAHCTESPLAPSECSDLCDREGRHRWHSDTVTSLRGQPSQQRPLSAGSTARVTSVLRQPPGIR